MKLEINTIITLENQERYVVLNETTYQDKKYFLVMAVDEKKEIIPSNVAIIEEIQDHDEIFVEKVTDPEQLLVLTKELKAQL